MAGGEVLEPVVSTLSSAEVLALVGGVTYRQLDYWTRVGYITPESAVRSGGAPGPTKLTDEVRAAIVKRRAAGQPLKQIARALGVSTTSVSLVLNGPKPSAVAPVGGTSVAVEDVATPGSGRQRRWSGTEVEVIRRMARLTAAGVSPDTAVRVASSPVGSRFVGSCVLITVTADEVGR